MGESIKNFYDLEAWRRANELALTFYEITRAFPREEVYGLTSQVRRAAISVGANISEGFARYYFKDKVRFYYQSRGSLSELQNYLFILRKLRYITDSCFHDLFNEVEIIGRLINGLIISIKKQ